MIAGITFEDLAVALLVTLLLYSYRYRISRLFHLNASAIVGNGSAYSRTAGQQDKIDSIKASTESKRQQVLGVHKDLDHVDAMLG